MERRLEILRNHIINGDKDLKTKNHCNEKSTGIIAVNNTYAYHTPSTPLVDFTNSPKSTELYCELNPKNGCLKLVLNRPKALNALSQEMLIGLKYYLRAGLVDERVKFVVLTTSKEAKAFCAGGDIKMLFKAKSIKDSSHFFNVEFNVDRMIARYNKPVIALLKGATMGGGAGISMFASHRVANEKHFQFSMPENAIGLYTDIGSSYFLTHYPPSKQIGMYLALTGQRIKAHDAYYCGLVTHIVKDTEELNDLEDALWKQELTSGDVDSPSHICRIIDDLLQKFQLPMAEVQKSSVIHQRHSQIDNIFQLDRVENILKRLHEEHGNQLRFEKSKDFQWLKDMITKIEDLSCPMSVKVTFEALKRGSMKQNIESIFFHDFRVATRMCIRSDFKEGVRCTLFDRSQKPKWSPPHINQIEQEDVDLIFDEPLEEEMKFWPL